MLARWKLAHFPPAALRRLNPAGQRAESGSFLEQDSTAVPKFAYRSFCPCGNLVGECLPQTLLMRLTPLKNPSKYFFGFFKNSSASHPVFLLLVRGHHAQKGGLAPCENDTTRRTAAGLVKTRHDRGRIRRVCGSGFLPYDMSQAGVYPASHNRQAAIRPIITMCPPSMTSCLPLSGS